ncbi:DUF4326 domain-containing protein [Jatrophihabitans sp.]|uniref:DUF4326 domain-containing protein n=1 Tax=Jatrophihabitans sp. TaxID=1932789 RepID=UPI002BC8CEF8|nr:DUF4326 domain-containing protein [Jatrophihabitans sp.]
MTTPERIQLRRTKGWRKPAGAIVVARPSKWGNPYRIDDYRTGHPDASDRELRRLAVEDFRRLAAGRAGEHRPYPWEAIGELAGRDLCCWCPADQPCHADVLLQLANPAERN